MFRQKLFQLSLTGKLQPIASALILLIVVLFLSMFILLFPISAQEPSQTSQISTQTDFPWSIHLYASPTSPDGVGLWVFTGQVADICEKVEFNADFLGAPTPIDGEYDTGKGVYFGFLDSFFNPGTGLQLGTITSVVCDLPNGDRLIDDNPIIFARYYYPNNGLEIEVNSDDGRGKLAIGTTSLNSPAFIIVMSTNALPGSLPDGVKPVGLPYSFHSFVTTSNSDQNMILNLIYEGLIGNENPLTLRIFEWDVANDTWLNIGNQNLSLTADDQLNKTTKQFTTYILGSTPRWRDNFSSDLGLATTNNIRRIGGELKLDNGGLTGSATSAPYTPTLEIVGWESISYTAEITTGTSMTISVLSQDGQVLRENVSPGLSLSDIDPISYPSLKLQVEMSTTSMGTSPELFEWSILARPDLKKVYLPVILRDF